MNSLPPRIADTMSDAIALSSPSGRMSKRARKSAEDRLTRALFGVSCNGLKGEGPPQPTERERMLTQAARLRELAARGMCTRKYMREALRLETLAAQQVSP